MVADGGPEGGEAREDGVDESAAGSFAGGSGRSQVRAARRRRRLKIVALGAAGVLVVAVGLGAYGYERIFGRIRSISLSGLTHRPAASKPNAEGQTPLNILVLGSQTRDGQHGVNLGNSSKGGTNLSDTAMLVHLSADRRWSVVASIPRDLVVPRPQCNARVGIGNQTSDTVVPGSDGDLFDAAMSIGGPSCAVATVEQMTGIRLDHFVEINFNAFQQLTDDVGGVQVCVPPPGINDPDYSGLVLSAGLHTVSGAQALEFVRDRHGIGDGTDLGRIQMQQMFTSSLFRKLSSNGTLTDPVTLFQIASDVAANLTVDSGLDSATAMVSLVESVKDLDSRYMQYITAPYEFDPLDRNRVIPGQDFGQVWDDLRADEPLTGSAAATAFGTTAEPDPRPDPRPKPSPSPPAGPTRVPLSAVKVTVYDGGGTPGLAANAAAVLTAQGVQATAGGDVSGSSPTTEVQYSAGQQAAAEALAADIPGAVVRADSDVQALTLVLGDNTPANLTNPPTPTASSNASSAPAASVSAESRSGDEDICSSLPTPVNYGGAPGD